MTRQSRKGVLSDAEALRKCALHNAVPLGRLDLYVSPPPNTSGLYVRRTPYLNRLIRPVNPAIMLDSIKKNTGVDLSNKFITELDKRFKEPKKKDLIIKEQRVVDYNPLPLNVSARSRVSISDKNLLSVNSEIRNALTQGTTQGVEIAIQADIPSTSEVLERYTSLQNATQQKDMLNDLIDRLAKEGINAYEIIDWNTAQRGSKAERKQQIRILIDKAYDLGTNIDLLAAFTPMSLVVQADEESFNNDDELTGIEMSEPPAALTTQDVQAPSSEAGTSSNFAGESEY